MKSVDCSFKQSKWNWWMNVIFYDQLNHCLNNVNWVEFNNWITFPHPLSVVIKLGRRCISLLYSNVLKWHSWTCIIHEFIQLSHRIHLTPLTGFWWNLGGGDDASWHVQNYTEMFRLARTGAASYVGRQPVYCCLVSCGTNNMQALFPRAQQTLVYSQLSKSP